MIKIPLALANAAEASFPTFVEDGRLVLRIRRTQARGGSNSTAEADPFAFPSTFVFSFVASATGADTFDGVVIVYEFRRDGWGFYSMLIRYALDTRLFG